MAKILLDYVFPVTVITPTPAASTAFLKQVCVVAKPKTGQEGNVGELYECTTMSQVAVRTDNENAQQLFTAGMAKVFILLADDLDLADFLEEHGQEFYTVLVSDDFDADDIAGAKATGSVTITAYTALVSGTPDTVSVAGTTFTAQAGAASPGAATFQAASSDEATATSLAAQINAHETVSDLVQAEVDGDEVVITAKTRGIGGNLLALAYTDNDTNAGATVSGGFLTGGTVAMALGTFDGVVGVSSDDTEMLEGQSVIEKRCAFFGATANGATNMFYAFGKLLADPSNWYNQQYIQMPVDDAVDALGEANSLFDERISFVLNDDEFGNRLSFFGVGGKAIVAPYITKNLVVDSQSRKLQWIAANQPQYTLTEASLLETRLQEDVLNLYVSRGWIEPGATVSITLENDNFVATGTINVSEPTGWWKTNVTMTQS